MYTLVNETDTIRVGVKTTYLMGRGYVSSVETSYFSNEFFSNVTQKIERIYSTPMLQDDKDAVFIPSARRNAKKELAAHNQRLQKIDFTLNQILDFDPLNLLGA